MLIAESISFRILTESVRRGQEVITQEKTHRKGSTHMESVQDAYGCTSVP
jgi:hypothetical protein